MRIANLNPNCGREVGDIRPVLVIQGDWLSAAQERTVAVLPLTSRIRLDAEPMRVVIRARGGLQMDSQVIVDQPRTLDRERLGEGPLTELSDSEMTDVERSLLAVMGVGGSVE